ncbi:hypothetical protein SAMN05216559_4054 [Halomicrobium zhouii]|uniref:Uncharacterized protein n=1 Tax=Halomicrobium zhouii TaxID=767519 RepID=A0A1I6M9P5_9EURY|nr:hypothetical protein [Halomicrobium zhouii]SFS12262.1 hypothetical protein SAMN05216559_4054 [Halomicrobium zhouii]
MSIASPFGFDRSASTVDVQTLRTIALRPIETVAFWAAVLIPLVYPALMYGGLDGQELFFLLGALALNAAALFLGRDYNRDQA